MVDSIPELKAALEKLPDTATIIVEDDFGWKYEVVRVFTIGTSTPDPGLVIKVKVR